MTHIAKRKTSALFGVHNDVDTPHEAYEEVRRIGQALASLGVILATPVSHGFPLWGALGAYEVGGVTIGFSPASNPFEHEHYFRLPKDHHSTIVYTGFGILGRDLVLVRSVDFAIVVLGDASLAHELALLSELQKITLVFIPSSVESHIPDDLGEFVEVYTNEETLVNRVRDLVV